MHELNCDIVLMQETHFTASMQKRVRNEWGSRVLFANRTSSARGVCMCFAKAMCIEKLQVKKDTNGRYLSVTFEMNNNSFMVSLNPEKFRFTWKRTRPLVMTKIDYFLTTQSALGMIKSCEIIPGLLSDHAFVMIEFDSVDQLRGRGFWKLNNEFLKSKEYIDNVNEILDNAESKYKEIDEDLKWECMKMEVNEYSLQFGQLRARAKKQQKQNLIHRKNQLEKKLACINLSAENAMTWINKINTKLDLVQNQLQEIAQEEIKGVILCSRTRWYENSEKNTKYFYRLEKTLGKNKVMTTLEVDGELIQDLQKILNEQAKFYEKLYTSDHSVRFHFPLDIKKAISEEQKTNLSASLTLEELGVALKTSKNDSVPGPDGITAAWLKMFWVKIKHTFLKVTNKVFEVKHIYQSARRGVITLIPKKEKDPKF